MSSYASLWDHPDAGYDVAPFLDLPWLVSLNGNAVHEARSWIASFGGGDREPDDVPTYVSVDDVPVGLHSTMGVPIVRFRGPEDALHVVLEAHTEDTSEDIAALRR